MTTNTVKEKKSMSTTTPETAFLISEPSQLECAVCGGSFASAETLIVKNAAGRPERVCVNCSKGKPKADPMAADWPDRLTVIRYNDGGFSATLAEPPEKVSVARAYYRDRSTAPQPAPDAEGEWRVVYDPTTSHPESYHIREAGNGDCIAHAATERQANEIVTDHTLAASVPKLVEALKGAVHAMKAYQYGNPDPTLANEIEQAVSAALATTQIQEKQ